jgi:phage terminase Nu1 subunit (DNA packaging protein)
MNPQNPPKQTQIAAALGVSPSAISQLKKKGMPTTTIEAARSWYESTRNPAQRKAGTTTTPPHQQPPHGAVGGVESFDSARRRLMIAQADKADMEAAETRGDLIRVDAVRSAWIPVIVATRDYLLQIPYRLGPVLAAETDADKVINLLIDEMHAALTHLSSGTLRSEPQSEPTAPATPA